MTELIFYEPRWFYSQLDETAYYGWLGQIHDVNKIKHLSFQTLGLQFPKGLSEDKLRELLAICARFDIPTTSIERYLKENSAAKPRAKSRAKQSLPTLGRISSANMWIVRPKPVCLGRMPGLRSTGDAICFFVWLSQLVAVGRWKIEDRKFFINVRKTSLAKRDLNDLLAFCRRYNLDLSPLRPFCMRVDRKYFADYWRKRLFKK